MKGISAKKLVPVLVIVILLAVLVFPHPTRAGAAADFTLGAIVNGVTTLILNLVQQAISFFADLFDKFIQWQTSNAIYEVVAVDQSWTIIRNFVNMFFILILIVMAFGTIFDIKQYTWREMLAPFLISALLVNFSLTIGQYIITIANGLSGIFLKQIGSVSSIFAQGSSLVNISTSGATDLISGATKVIATEIFAVIFLTVVMLAFAAAAIFSLVRIFVLWFLLIISPIAWIGYSLPNLRSQTWSEWWKHFFCWCFFLPYYLFFVMFAVIFVKNRSTIPPIPGNNITAGMTGTDFLFYCLSLIFLIGGLVVARKMACASGTYIKQVFGTIEGGVRKYAPGAAYVRGGLAGLKARSEEIQEKGILGIGGAQRVRETEIKAKGWIAGIPGLGSVPGAREEASRAMSAETDKEVKKLQTLNLTLDQLNEKLKSSSKPERLAAFKLKAENGWLEASDLDTVNKTIEEAGGGRTAMGASIIQSLKKGKFEEMAEGTEAKERIYAALQDAEVKKAYGRAMAESGEVKDQAIARSLLNLYQGEAQVEQDRIRQLIKNNMENMYRNKSEREAFVTATVVDDLDGELKKMAAQVMVDKGEVDLRLRERIIELNGGRDGVGRIKEKQMQELDKKLLANVEKGKVSEALLPPADQKAVFDGLTEPEVQKAFGMAMAKNRAVMDEDLATRILDLYSGDTLEIQEKAQEEIKKNIEKMAETKDSSLRTVYLSNAANDRTMRKLVGQIMVDKKEVTDWKIRREILSLNGGIDPATGEPQTAEGKDLAKGINDGNVLFKEETEYRKATGTRPAIPHDVDLNATQRAEVHEQILGNIKAGYIKGFSAEELKTPEIFNALWYGFHAPPTPALAITPAEFKKLTGISGKGKPDRKKRMAAEAIRTAIAPMAY